MGTRKLSSLIIVLLGIGVPVPVDAAQNDEPLIDAVKKEDVQVVESLLGRATDVNATTADGATPLHWAVHRDNTVLVDLLIAAGADVTATNRYGVHPIALAAENGNASILEALLIASRWIQEDAADVFEDDVVFLASLIFHQPQVRSGPVDPVARGGIAEPADLVLSLSVVPELVETVVVYHTDAV